MQDLTENSYTDSNKRRSLKTLLKRLEEALRYIKILGGIVPNSKIFMDKILKIIETNFESLIDQLEEDSSFYLDLSMENAKNILPLANIYE